MTAPKTPRIICFGPGIDAPLASYWDLSPQNMDEIREKSAFFFGNRPMRIQYKLLLRLHHATI
jgi:hypothetical protein